MRECLPGTLFTVLGVGTLTHTVSLCTDWILTSVRHVLLNLSVCVEVKNTKWKEY